LKPVVPQTARLRGQGCFRSVLIADFYFVVADAAIVGGQEVYGFFGDDGGFAVGAGEAFDGFERGPERFDNHFHDDAVGLRQDASLDEAVLRAEMGKHMLIEVAEVIRQAKLGCAGGPESDDHFRLLLGWL
jgi:hypothetical protein